MCYLFDRDYIDFLEDLEEDPAIRANINIYRNEEKFNMASTTPSEAGDDIPVIGLDEMLEDLQTEDDVGGDEPTENQGEGE